MFVRRSVVRPVVPAMLSQATVLLVGARCASSSAFHASRVTRAPETPAADAPAPNAWVTKIKAEALKMLKLQLMIVVVGTALMLLVFPPPSKSEEKRLIAEYERSAGWKT